METSDGKEDDMKEDMDKLKAAISMGVPKNDVGGSVAPPSQKPRTARPWLGVNSRSQQKSKGKGKARNSYGRQQDQSKAKGSKGTSKGTSEGRIGKGKGGKPGGHKDRWW